MPAWQHDKDAKGLGVGKAAANGNEWCMLRGVMWSELKGAVEGVHCSAARSLFGVGLQLRLQQWELEALNVHADALPQSATDSEAASLQLAWWVAV